MYWEQFAVFFFFFALLYIWPLFHVFTRLAFCPVAYSLAQYNALPCYMAMALRGVSIYIFLFLFFALFFNRSVSIIELAYRV